MVILSHDPPKTRGQPPVHRAPRERSAAAPAVCGYSMRRFLPTAGASSASGTKPYEEPTCTIMAPVSPVHECPCGRSMHGFCGRAIWEEGYGQQRECTDCQKITPGDKTGVLSSPMELDADVLSEEGGGGGRPESCITSSITEVEVHSRFEEIRSYLYAEGRGGEYSETQYLLSKVVNSFMEEVEHFWRTTTAVLQNKVLVVFGTRML